MPEHGVDVVGVGRDRDELHAALASGTGEDVDGEHPAEKPRPRMPGRRWSGGWLERRGGADLEEGELGGPLFFGGRGSGNDLGACLGMGSEDAVISEHVKAGRGDEGTEACEKIERVEKDGARAVFPGSFEAIANPPVVPKVESVLGEGGPSDVAAEALESPPPPSLEMAETAWIALEVSCAPE